MTIQNRIKMVNTKSRALQWVGLESTTCTSIDICKSFNESGQHAMKSQRRECGLFKNSCPTSMFHNFYQINNDSNIHKKLKLKIITPRNTLQGCSNLPVNMKSIQNLELMKLEK